MTTVPDDRAERRAQQSTPDTSSYGGDDAYSDDGSGGDLLIVGGLALGAGGLAWWLLHKKSPTTTNPGGGTTVNPPATGGPVTIPAVPAFPSWWKNADANAKLASVVTALMLGRWPQTQPKPSDTGGQYAWWKGVGTQGATGIRGVTYGIAFAPGDEFVSHISNLIHSDAVAGANASLYPEMWVRACYAALFGRDPGLAATPDASYQQWIAVYGAKGAPTTGFDIANAGAEFSARVHDIAGV